MARSLWWDKEVGRVPACLRSSGGEWMDKAEGVMKGGAAWEKVL